MGVSRSIGASRFRSQRGEEDGSRSLGASRSKSDGRGTSSSRARQYRAIEYEDTNEDAVEDVLSVIQFGCEVYFVEEALEAVAEIDVVRFGLTTERAAVDFSTQDGSAIAGIKYEQNSGTLNFAPGELSKTIQIPIIWSSDWNATLEFAVHLGNIQGAQLGKYMYTCRVKILDRDCFPTNRYADYFRSKKVETIPGLSLFFEYVKMTLRDHRNFRLTMAYILADSIKGLYFLFGLYLQVYLIDVVLEYDPEDEVEKKEAAMDKGVLWLSELIIPYHPMRTAAVLALLYLAPLIALHVVDLWKCKAQLPGRLRTFLQTNLVRKFLSYKEEVRTNFSPKQLGWIMTQGVSKVVDDGYMSMLALVRIVLKMLMLLVFILTDNKTAVVPLIACPVAVAIFMRTREDITDVAGKERLQKEDKLRHHVVDTAHEYQLISDFHLRSYTIDVLEKRLDAFHTLEAWANTVTMNNMYAAPWLVTIVIAVYMVLGSMQVRAGTTSVGVFVMTILVFKELGADLQELNVKCFEVRSAIEPFRNIAKSMNLATDLADRMRVNESRLKQGKKRRSQAEAKAAEAKASGVDFAVDTVPFEASHLTFAYPGCEPIIRNVSLEFEQGKLYALIGPTGVGKATFLKLLGQVLLPQENGGTIFLPPHLRIVHVNQNMLLPGSFFRNLVLNSRLKDVGGKTRVQNILNMLNFEKELIDLLDLPEEEASSSEWMARLPKSAYARITLARVFIMNPEVVVMHSPLSLFNEAEQERLAYLLRQHVERKGLDLPEKQQRFRRPRTVFFTAGNLSVVKAAHKVYAFGEEEEGIHLLSVDETLESGKRAEAWEAILQKHLS